MRCMCSELGTTAKNYKLASYCPQRSVTKYIIVHITYISNLILHLYEFAYHLFYFKSFILYFGHHKALIVQFHKESKVLHK